MKLEKFKHIALPMIENQLLASVGTISQPRLKEAMTYSLINGGKRVRPLLLLAVLQACRQPLDQGIFCAVALEYIHTYSLIHDDLPAMDNDDVRRGKPTSHKKFDEATAILAGDGCQTMAFDILAQSHAPKSVVLSLVLELSRASGPNGMIGGQMDDILAERQQVSLEQLIHIHRLKTGELLTFAMTAGGKLAAVSNEVLSLLRSFGYSFGLAFQIHNDLQDIAQDSKLQKSTYVSILGEKTAKKLLQDEINNAVSAIDNIKKLTPEFDDELILDFINYIK